MSVGVFVCVCVCLCVCEYVCVFVRPEIHNSYPIVAKAVKFEKELGDRMGTLMVGDWKWQLSIETDKEP